MVLFWFICMYDVVAVVSTFVYGLLSVICYLGSSFVCSWCSLCYVMLC